MLRNLLSKLTCGRLPSSSEPAPAPLPAAAAPLEDDNLLAEILLRLAPLPSSLPRASLVCNRWRHLVSDRRFIRRFRAHHRRNPPPLLGFFEEIADRVHPYTYYLTPGATNSLSLNPIPDPPNRVPVGRFSLHFHDGDTHMNLGCRDGLVLLISTAQHGFWDAVIKVLVWDPVTGDLHRFSVPRMHRGRDGMEVLNGAVLRTAGIQDDRPFRFQVVMVGIDWKNNRAFALVYSSETDKWCDPVYSSTDSSSSTDFTVVSMRASSTLVGNSLYWKLYGNAGILQYDLDSQNLAVIPVGMIVRSDDIRYFLVMRADGDRLGILELLDFNVRLWKGKIHSDGVVSWVLTKTIELDQLLPLEKDKERPRMMGYCEDNNVVFLSTILGVFMVDIESLKFKTTPIDSSYHLVHPFTSIYIPDMFIGGGHDGAKLLLNA